MKKEKTTTVIFLTILGLIFFSMVVNYLFVKLQPKTEATPQNNKLTYATIDWEEQYPFETGEKETVSLSQDSIKQTSAENPGILGKIKQTLKSIAPIYKTVVFYSNFSDTFTTKWEGFVKSYFVGKENFLYAYGKLNKFVGLGMVKDTETTAIDIGNGYLTTIGKTGKQNNDTAIQNTIDFSQWLSDRDIDFMLVSAPSKIIGEEETISNIVENTGKEYKEKLCKILQDNNVAVLDLSAYMPTEYDAYMEKFYYTDHHWKVSTGLWAAQMIGSKLVLDYDYQIDTTILEDSQYITTTSPNLFLGSTGKKMTLGYAEPEDFDVIEPAFENHLHIQIPKITMDVDGDFSTLINPTQLEYGKVYSLNPYGAYTYGDQPLIKLTNSDAKCKKRILVLKDSYANAVVPFLSMVCETVDIIDLRAFNGSLKTYINENAYDMVMFITNTNGVGSKTAINKINSIWYFE